MAKKPKYLVDGVSSNHRVRAWKERRNIIVHVWLDQGHRQEPVGEPEGDWEMPGVLGVELAIAQAVAQTHKK